VRAVENGLSIFDMPLSASMADREQWRPIVAWLGEVAFKPVASVETAAISHISPINRATVTASSVTAITLNSAERPNLVGDHENSQKTSSFARFIPKVFRRKS
jgi:hypothetical protein